MMGHFACKLDGLFLCKCGFLSRKRCEWTILHADIQNSVCAWL